MHSYLYLMRPLPRVLVLELSFLWHHRLDEIAFNGFLPTALIHLLVRFKCGNRSTDVKIFGITAKTAIAFGTNRPVTAPHPANILTSGTVAQRVFDVN